MLAKSNDQVLKASAEHIVIGHDILSLISSAMYTEPLTIYRELAQNSADAIDGALQTGTISKASARIDLTIDPLNRRIVISDNGTGITNVDFISTMCAIGASKKRGTKARGFRGIGRLVGLGYCQELVFRSRSVAEEDVLQASWDCRRLRELLRSTAKHSLADVIAEVVTISRSRGEPNAPAHFFEVELRRVVRLASDALLNVDRVTRYLEEIAPVPFDSRFRFGGKIASFLSERIDYTPLSIHVNGSSQCLTRPYRDSNIALSKSKMTNLVDVSFCEVPSHDGERGAVAWVAHHDYLGAFPRDMGIRGIRSRVGDVQIGDESCLDVVFAEARFNQWALGEVHIIDDRIVPNGRRDGFEPNLHFENLCNHLAVVGKDIVRRCRSSSNERRKERRFSDLEKALRIYGTLIRRNRVAQVMKSELLDDVRDQVERTRRNVNATDRRSWDAAIAKIERQIDSLENADVRGRGAPRASQREMGRADVLRLLREEIPGGTSMSVALLKLLTDERLF
jgi:molecular chaperone HtpG